MRLAYLPVIAAFSFMVQTAQAFEVEEHYVHRGLGDEVLRIISTADAAAFNPIITAFQQQYPSVTVDYTIASSAQVFHALYNEGAVFDLAISSAMDLQTKLANDGFVLTYESEVTETLPSWAKWRDQLFAFTQEPAVMVVSEDDFVDRRIPMSREELITMLRENPETFDGRIGTYDVRISGAGYLFATQDSRNTDSYWRLTEVMGRLNARLYSGSQGMIKDVAEGRLALAYNVVGSYAKSQLATTPGIRIVEFDDYLSVMLRTALIPKTAENVARAGDMIDFLSRLNEREDVIAQTNLPPINALELENNSASRVIRLGPGLLVFLDRMKKETFLRSWENSMEQK
ncbi:ABC transporter substrate-binding protein [Falsihalocynthiibacter sp. SS001]|uniref:ABC transporter substrate-binding protein n=1 Tax=Falsihalocynthiibacter sp. SS001 TaxID=3349698 RepID=UPI0036D3FB4D